uniref:Uncharacterized protein n=1 Tax=Anguilla anguilla TaxID=7936 RepID=A0A0E9W7L0_ANGAN
MWKQELTEKPTSINTLVPNNFIFYRSFRLTN